MKARKDPSKAKSMVMIPLYGPRVVQDKTKYSRKSKHRASADMRGQG